MKSTQFFAAAACAFLMSATAFAQTTPSGTMQSGTSTGTMQNGTSTGTMQNGTNTGRMQDGTGTMQNGSMNSKNKMNRKGGMKKGKMSTTPTSTGSGTM